MYTNIGGKIKSLAKIIFGIETAVSIIVGIILLSIGTNMHYGGEGLTIAGGLLMCLGWLVAWISSFFMYGFGELIEKTCSIEQILKPTTDKSQQTPQAPPVNAENTKETVQQNETDVSNESQPTNPNEEDSPLKSAFSMLFSSSGDN